MNLAKALGAAAIAVFCSSGVSARAQSATATHFGRTTTGVVAPGRRAPALERAAATTRPVNDPLAPYTSRPQGAVSGAPAVIAPERPAPRPVVRNYFPTARVGRYSSATAQVGGDHCTPSRAFVFGISR